MNEFAKDVLFFRGDKMEIFLGIFTWMVFIVSIVVVVWRFTVTQDWSNYILTFIVALAWIFFIVNNVIDD